jgi:predicted dehydrogenase
MIGVGVIGYGYWGPNLVRNLAEAQGASLAAVCDLRPERLALAARRHPGVRLTTDWRDLLADPGVAAVVVATPLATHFDLALAALRAGRHVLVEKPLAASSEQARRLIDEALRRGLVLMVDHTFVNTPAVAKIRELVSSNHLGQIFYYDSIRVNLGLFQPDHSVIWDLAVHDLAIMDHVLASRPRAVSATGASHVPGQPENVAYLTVFYDDHLVAHVNVNWLAPVKLRQTLIGGSQRMIVYDDLEPSEKIRVYDKGIQVSPNDEQLYQTLIGYRTGDMWAPRLELTEALKTEVAHFLGCVEKGGGPLTDGWMGLRIVRLLEAANLSVQGQGRPVEMGEMG